MPHRDDRLRDLLSCLIALRDGFVSRERLIDVYDSWTSSGDVSLADLLIGRGFLSAEQKAILEARVEEDLRNRAETVLSTRDSSQANNSTNPDGDPTIDSNPEATVTHAPTRTKTLARPEAIAGLDGFSEPLHVRSGSAGARYELIRAHKSGGIGMVYLALDHELNREVALKCMKPEKLHDEESHARFLLEAEVTGNLEHPGIVPVYGFGVGDDGRPYYAMKFLRGGTLKDEINAFHSDPTLRSEPGRRALALRALISRLIDVCNAVGYAHSRGVIHRDIKPSNIAVGRHGETIVVDWGLAKVRGRADSRASVGDFEEEPLKVRSGSGSEQTRGGSIFGTPEYMSPEQASGLVELHGPRSDVYSLGATLYCILTGRSPFSGNSDGICRDVCAGRFRKPREKDPSIDRALEGICLKAMALAPENRYPDAEALADDLQRWAADEPVSAWSEPASRRLRRWARRHRTLASSLLVTLLLLAAGLSVGVIVVNRERTKAEELLVIAHNLSGTLVDTAEREMSRIPGSELRREEILKSAVKDLSRLADQRPDDAGLARESGTAHFYLANIQRFFNRNVESEKSFHQAAERLGRAVALDPNDDRSSDLTAEVLRDRAALAARVGRTKDAEEMLRRALKIVDDLLAKSPGTIDYQRTRAGILYAYADVASDLGQTTEAEAAASEAAKRFRELRRMTVRDGKVIPVYATSASARSVPLLTLMAINRHAVTLGELGRREEQLKLQDEALGLASELRKVEGSLDSRMQYAMTLYQRTKVLASIPGRESSAETAVVETIREFDDLRKVNSSSLAYEEGLALARAVLAKIRRSQNRMAEARNEIDAAVSGLASRIGRVSDISRLHWELGLLKEEAALIERAGGRIEQANLLLREAIDSLKRAVELAPNNVVFSRDLKRVQDEISRPR